MFSKDITMVLKCMLGGVADYLTKPMTKNELKNIWKHVWRRLSVNDDVINTHAQSLAASQHNLEDDSVDSRCYSDQGSGYKCFVLCGLLCMSFQKGSLNNCYKEELFQPKVSILLLISCLELTRYADILEDLKKDPESHGGPPYCILLCRIFEIILRELGFRDIFKKLKDEENAKVISLFPEVVCLSDAIEDEGKRIDNLVKTC